MAWKLMREYLLTLPVKHTQQICKTNLKLFSSSCFHKWWEDWGPTKGANKGIKTETDTATSEWPDPGNISPTLLDGHDYFYMKSPSALPRRLSRCASTAITLFPKQRSLAPLSVTRIRPGTALWNTLTYAYISGEQARTLYLHLLKTLCSKICARWFLVIF